MLTCPAPPGSAGWHAPKASSRCKLVISAATAPRIISCSPEHWWPAADLHASVFCEEHGKPPSKPHDAGDSWLTSFTQASAHLGYLFNRIDRISCINSNYVVSKSGFGKDLVLAAYAPPEQDCQLEPDSSEQEWVSSTGASPQHVPSSELPEWALELARKLVPSSVRPHVDLKARDANMVGVACLDTFYDLVPARTLDFKRDGAFGWQKREGVAYLSNVCVARDARRMGLARSLVAEAERTASLWGCRAVGLHVSPDNTSAVELYKALGFRPTPYLEDPWLPYLMGRAPTRCRFMIKRLKTSVPDATNQIADEVVAMS